MMLSPSEPPGRDSTFTVMPGFCAMNASAALSAAFTVFWLLVTRKVREIPSPPPLEPRLPALQPARASATPAASAIIRRRPRGDVCFLIWTSLSGREFKRFRCCGDPKRAPDVRQVTA
jgi:hypothetical protein